MIDGGWYTTFYTKDRFTLGRPAGDLTVASFTQTVTTWQKAFLATPGVTMTKPTPAIVGNAQGFWVKVTNSSSGPVTLLTSSGGTPFILQPGQVCRVDYAGGTQTKITVAVVRLPYQPDIYDTAITFTQPIVDSIRVNIP